MVFLPNVTEVNALKSEISHTCDGPVTPFVAIGRAMRLMNVGYTDKIQPIDPKALSEALYEVLIEIGVKGMDLDGLRSTEY